MAELLRIQRTCGGGWWWIPSKNLATSDRLVVRESVGLGQRGSDNMKMRSRLSLPKSITVGLLVGSRMKFI